MHFIEEHIDWLADCAHWLSRWNMFVVIITLPSCFSFLLCSPAHPACCNVICLSCRSIYTLLSHHPAASSSSLLFFCWHMISQQQYLQVLRITVAQQSFYKVLAIWRSLYLSVCLCVWLFGGWIGWLAFCLGRIAYVWVSVGLSVAW